MPSRVRDTCGEVWRARGTVVEYSHSSSTRHSHESLVVLVYSRLLVRA